MLTNWSSVIQKLSGGATYKVSGFLIYEKTGVQPRFYPVCGCVEKLEQFSGHLISYQGTGFPADGTWQQLSHTFRLTPSFLKGRQAPGLSRPWPQRSGQPWCVQGQHRLCQVPSCPISQERRSIHKPSRVHQFWPTGPVACNKYFLSWIAGITSYMSKSILPSFLIKGFWLFFNKSRTFLSVCQGHLLPGLTKEL